MQMQPCLWFELQSQHEGRNSTDLCPNSQGFFQSLQMRTEKLIERGVLKENPASDGAPDLQPRALLQQGSTGLKEKYCYQTQSWKNIEFQSRNGFKCLSQSQEDSAGLEGDVNLCTAHPALLLLEESLMSPRPDPGPWTGKEIFPRSLWNLAEPGTLQEPPQCLIFVALT